MGTLNLAFVRFVIGGAVVCALTFLFIACDEMSPSPGPTPPVPKPPTTQDYIGVHRGEVGRTFINLEVTRDSFTAVAVTAPDTEASARALGQYQPANVSDSVGASWVVFTGGVTTSGTTVTVSISGVERDGEALSGAELDVYARCAVTATAGDEFAAKVIAAIASCLGTTADDVMVYQRESRASDRVLGSWSWYHPPLGQYTESITMSISHTEVTITVVSILHELLPDNTLRPYTRTEVWTFDVSNTAVYMDWEFRSYSDGSMVLRRDSIPDDKRHQLRFYDFRAHYVIGSSGDRMLVNLTRSADGRSQSAWFTRVE